jgi:hypothetical protein
MPTVEQILIGLKEIANTWQTVAIFWHVYFAAIIIVLIFGIRPSKRIGGILLGLPLLSVSIIAWVSSNPFNGMIYGLISIIVFYISTKLPRENVQVAPLWVWIPGILMFIFGWVYPHFLDTSSFWSYLYSAPTGLIPCPTLSIVIGLTMVLNGLNSRALLLILGIMGMFYGITGVAQLGVSIDGVLLLGAVMIVIVAFLGKYSTPAEAVVK